MNKVFHTYISREHWNTMTDYEKKNFIQKSLKEEEVIDHLSVKTVVEYDLDMVSITNILESVDV